MKKKVLKGEFIGREIEIVSAPQKTLVGIRGIVVDETKHMLIIHVDGEDMKISKQNLVFKILPEGYQIDGNKIMFRPEDRIKKIRR
ncbi:MAG: ribonuclease P component 1 family protein [Thermoplasmata archaeon]